MKNILFKYLLFLLIYLFNVESSKILVFSPTISRSHMISNARIADTLASDGHNVTLLEVEFLAKVGELNASKVANTLLVPGQFIDPKEFNSSMIAEMSFKSVFLPMDFLVGTILQTSFNIACESKLKREGQITVQSKYWQILFLYIFWANSTSVEQLINKNQEVCRNKRGIHEAKLNIQEVLNPRKVKKEGCELQ
ncbi:unnamed protein product [Meloidogyne enterolobii]|uniref:Uncharacterized protein n=1 Tax=Meloidogyne enterolobii TaxID=390850 RepID=A0ACB0YHJ0_MELEN